MHDDAGRVGGNHGVGVALDAFVVGVADGHVQVGGRRRHRAEQLAAVDPPARIGARGAGGRPREVLAALADRGGQHNAVARDLLERRREAAGATLLTGRHGDLATALHVLHGDEVHVDADRDRGVATREAARSHDEVVRRGHAEAAELDRDGRREVAGRLERVDRLERVAAVTVVLRRAGGELLRELLSERSPGGRRHRYGLSVRSAW